MGMPGSLSGVGAGVTFGLAGHRLIYFNDTNTIKVPTCLLAHNALNGAKTVFLVLKVVLPTFLLTVCRGSNLPFRGIIQGVVQTGFLEPKVETCQARGVCTPFTKPNTKGRSIVRGRGRGGQDHHRKWEPNNPIYPASGPMSIRTPKQYIRTPK